MSILKGELQYQIEIMLLWEGHFLCCFLLATPPFYLWRIFCSIAVAFPFRQDQVVIIVVVRP